MSMRTHRLLPEERDAGDIAIFAVIVIGGLLLLLALVVDGGGKLKMKERADAAAQEAARAGGEQIDAGQAIPGNAIVVDPGAATQAAYAYLQQAGFSHGASVEVTDGGRRLVVDITTSYSSVLGIGSMPVHGHATASLVYGVTTPKGP
jgi:hypothetical protein